MRDDAARDRIRKWFLKSGMTQKRFAEKVGWKQPTMNSFLLGNHNTDLDTLALMARALGRTLVDVVGEDDPEETEESRLVAAFNAVPTEEERAAILHLIETIRKEARASGDERRSVRVPAPASGGPRGSKRADGGR